MKTFRIYKQVINEFEIEVRASSPNQALKKAIDGDHAPEKFTSEFCDGENHRPDLWVVTDLKGEVQDTSLKMDYTVIGIFTNEQTFATIVQATSPEDAYRAAAQDILKESPSSLSFVTFIAAIPGDHVVEGDEWVNAEDLVGAE
jgi:hypothetical protein